MSAVRKRPRASVTKIYGDGKLGSYLSGGLPACLPVRLFVACTGSDHARPQSVYGLADETRSVRRTVNCFTYGGRLWSQSRSDRQDAEKLLLSNAGRRPSEIRQAACIDRPPVQHWS